jgi:MFS family permease
MPDGATQPTGFVRTDVICLGCGYNLRALELAGHCPECNWPIARSIHGDLLRYADAHWRTGLKRGVWLVHRGLFVAVTGMILIIVFSAFIATLNLSSMVALMISGLLIAMASMASMVAAPIMIIIGWWFACTRDPAESESTATERSLLRITGMLALPVFAGWISLRGLMIGAAATEVLAFACLVFMTAHLIVLANFMRRIHRRCAQTDERRARKRMRLLKRLRGYAIGVPALALVLHLLILAMAWYTGARAAVPLGWGMGVGWVLTLLAWISLTSHLNATLREIKSEIAAGDSDLQAVSAESGVAAPHSAQEVAVPSPERS